MFFKMIVSMVYVPLLLCALMLLACGDETGSLPVVSNEPEPPCRTSYEDNCEYGVLIDDRDGQTYKTVKIRDQWWMRENLKFRYVQPTSTLDSSSFCYNDTLEYCGIDGRLYLWSAAMDSAGVYTDNGKGCGNGSECQHADVVRGVCPLGWHLPSQEDWDILMESTGVGSFGGEKLKAVTTWNSNGTDDYSFSAYPIATMYYYNGQYDYSRRVYYGNDAVYWSTASKDSLNSVALILRSADHHVSFGAYGYAKFNTAPVRCVKD